MPLELINLYGNTDSHTAWHNNFYDYVLEYKLVYVINISCAFWN